MYITIAKNQRTLPWHDGQHEIHHGSVALHTSTRMREQSGEGLTYAGVEEEAQGVGGGDAKHNIGTPSSSPGARCACHPCKPACGRRISCAPM